MQRNRNVLTSLPSFACRGFFITGSDHACSFVLTSVSVTLIAHSDVQKFIPFVKVRLFSWFFLRPNNNNKKIIFLSLKISCSRFLLRKISKSVSCSFFFWLQNKNGSRGLNFHQLKCFHEAIKKCNCVAKCYTMIPTSHIFKHRRSVYCPHE